MAASEYTFPLFDNSVLNYGQNLPYRERQSKVVKHMIWYSVDIRCDGFLIAFMKSRDANLATSTNLRARVGYIYG